MKKSIPPVASQKAAGSVEQARTQVVAAKATVEAAKRDSRTAKQQRKLAKEAVRRAKKRLKKAKAAAVEARRELTKAEKLFAQETEEAMVANQKPRKKRPTEVAVKTAAPAKPAKKKPRAKARRRREKVRSGAPAVQPAADRPAVAAQESTETPAPLMASVAELSVETPSGSASPQQAP